MCYCRWGEVGSNRYEIGRDSANGQEQSQAAETSGWSSHTAIQTYQGSRHSEQGGGKPSGVQGAASVSNGFGEEDQRRGYTGQSNAAYHKGRTTSMMGSIGSDIGTAADDISKIPDFDEPSLGVWQHFTDRSKAGRQQANSATVPSTNGFGRPQARYPKVSPELEALVAKHAPQELHLLRPSSQGGLLKGRGTPRRGPRLTDLLDTGQRQEAISASFITKLPMLSLVSCQVIVNATL